MKILMLCYEFPPLGGGASRVVDGLSRELSRGGHEVDVVTMAFRDLPRRETVHGTEVHRVRCVRLKEHFCTMPEVATYLLAAGSKIRDLVARRGHDVVHAHFILPDGLHALRVKRSAGLPYLITAHGSDVPGYNPHRVRLTHRLLAPVWSRVARNAAVIVCPSLSIHDLVARRDPGLATTEIPYGFDVGRFEPEAPRSRRILVVTRMLRRKGVQHFLKAIAPLTLQHDVHVVGDGPYLPELRRMAAACKTPVVFHGWLDNRSETLTSLYRSSEIFVLASEAENFPVALMEAMDAGLAIVTTRGTGCAEVVGDAAILVEPRDPEGVRRALLQLTADPELCRERGRAARRRIESLFAWPRVAARYVELYERHRMRRA